MKVRFADIDSGLTVELKGGEEWLAGIRKTFVRGIKEDFSGSIALRRLARDRFEVKIDVGFTPILPCAKCNESIEMKFKIAEEAVVENSKERIYADRKSVELQPEDFEVYSMPGAFLDVEVILNDAVQLAIPDQCVALENRESGHERCSVCDMTF